MTWYSVLHLSLFVRAIVCLAIARSSRCLAAATSSSAAVTFSRESSHFSMTCVSFEAKSFDIYNKNILLLCRGCYDCGNNTVTFGGSASDFCMEVGIHPSSVLQFLFGLRNPRLEFDDFGLKCGNLTHHKITKYFLISFRRVCNAEASPDSVIRVMIVHLIP